MVESELGLIPLEWKISIIKDVCLNNQVICGKTPSTKNKDNFGNFIPFIKIPDMHGKTFVLDTSEKLSQVGAETQSSKMLPKNSICVSCIGTPGLVVLTSKESQTNQQINSIIPKDDNYLYYLFQNLRLRKDEIKALGSAGTTLYNLNKTNFEKIKILIPTHEILNSYYSMVKNIYEMILRNEREIIKLSILRDELLPKLMSGEIEVPIEE